MKDNNYPENLLIAARQKVKERDYWLDKLSGNPVISNFFYDNKMDGNKKNRETIDFKLQGDVFLKLMEFSKGSDHTLHMILTAALVLLVNKYTGNQDNIIGTPI